MFDSTDSFVRFLHDAQTEFLAMFERVDGGQQTVQRRSWQRPGGGGGQMGVLRGAVVEKGACNVSVVHGSRSSIGYGSGLVSDELFGGSSQLSPAGSRQGVSQPGVTLDQDQAERFFACGLSSIVHMANPHAPIAHLNVRYFQLGDDAWFGGGADLTPCIAYEQDTQAFHGMLKEVCLRYHPRAHEAYQEYKTWCDEYYFIKHRQQPRGVGGIFFDRLRLSFTDAAAFLTHLVQGYCGVLEAIYERRKNMSFSEVQKEDQLYWRGRYVEFNLLYDKGTKFGLESGGDLEAIFVSLPPVVRW